MFVKWARENMSDNVTSVYESEMGEVDTTRHTVEYTANSYKIRNFIRLYSLCQNIRDILA